MWILLFLSWMCLVAFRIVTCRIQIHPFIAAAVVCWLLFVFLIEAGLSQYISCCHVYNVI